MAESIADPGIRAGTLARLADMLPGREKARKLAILERALIQAKAASEPDGFAYRVGDVAGRFFELGETGKAKELFALALARAKQTDVVTFQRMSFAALLARVDSSGALELAKTGAAGGRLVPSIAFGLPWDRPAEANRFLSLYPPEKKPQWLTPVITWRIATLDLERAQKLVETRRSDRDYFLHQFCLALGAKGRDEPVMRAAVQAGMQELDRVLGDNPLTLLRNGGPALAVVEAIDPTLVPEVMWRVVAGRPPSPNPRTFIRNAECISWYDVELAGAMLEPTLARVEKLSDAELKSWEFAFEAWTLIDPRAAVARLKRIPMTSTNPNDNRLRIYVVEKLSLDRDARWRNTFLEWEPIFNPSVRDYTFDHF